MNNYINEFLSLSFRNPADWAVLILALLATFALGWRRVFSSFDLALLAVAAYLSFHSRRDGWVMVLAGLTILARRRDGAEATVRPPARLTASPLEALAVARASPCSWPSSGGTATSPGSASSSPRGLIIRRGRPPSSRARAMAGPSSTISTGAAI